RRRHTRFSRDWSSDVCSSDLDCIGLGGATNGTVSFNAQTNTITFTPANNYTGAAGFTYAISDGRGGTASAAVTLNVTQPPPNQRSEERREGKEGQSTKET